MRYNYCMCVCTFGGMATGVNAQKHLRLLLSYLGAQWLFKARPSFQYTLKPKYVQTHRFVSPSCIKRGPHLGAKRTLLPCDSRLFTPVPHIPLASLLDWVSHCIDRNQTKWSNTCMPHQSNGTKLSAVLPVWLCALCVCFSVHSGAPLRLC